MATERIQIIVTDTGTVTVKRNLDAVASSSQRAGDGVNYLKGLIASLVTGYAVQQLFQLADAGTQLSNALTVAGLQGQEFIDTQNDLFQIAKDNGQNVNELAGIYQRLTAAQGNLDISQDDVMEGLRDIAAGFKLSSASAAAQSGALQQLQQLLGGTNVEMQDFRSLIDGAYPILQAVARGSDEFGGSVGALINRVRQGGYAVTDFFDALRKGSDINRQLAESWNLSIGQALTNFKTNLIQTVLELNQSTGAFTLMADAINFVGNNLGAVTWALSPLIAALTILAVQVIGAGVLAAFTTLHTTLAAFASFLFTTLIPAIARLTVVLLTNPFFAAAAIAAVAGIVIYRKELEGLVGDIENTITGLTNLKGAIPGLDKGKIQFDATQAAQQLAGAGPALGQKSGNEIANRMRAAGTDAGDIIARGMTNAALSTAQLQEASQARAIANYEALNGRVQAATAATLVEGGKYLYNSIDGSVIKATPTMQTGIENGGTNAAGSMHDAIVSAGTQVAAQIAMSWRTREAGILAAQGYTGAMMNETGTGLATKLDAFGYERPPTTILPWGPPEEDENNYDNWNRNGSSNDNNSSSSSTSTAPAGQGSTVNLTNVNVLDPTIIPTAMDTADGRKVMTNWLKANREEVQAILGVT